MPLKRSTPIQIIIAVIVGLVLVLLLSTLIDAYFFNWQYTGFGPKTIWDWLELLIIPVVLAIGGYMFTRADKQAELDRAEQQVRTEREIAEQRAQDALLQTYLDQMTELLLEKGLRTSKPGDEIRHVALVRTLIILRRLDRERRKVVMQFLQNSRLVVTNDIEGVVSFEMADLSGTNLSNTPMSSIKFTGANLYEANLSEADLRDCDLSNTNLRGANLRGTNLLQANLEGANLEGADLTDANLTRARLDNAQLDNATLYKTTLSRASLIRATLREVDLRQAILDWADLKEAYIGQSDLDSVDLCEAILVHTNFQGSNLQHVNFQDALIEGAWLSKVNLKGSNITVRQLTLCKSLSGATMPDGSIHE